MSKSRELKQDLSVQVAHSIHEKLASIMSSDEQIFSATTKFSQQAEDRKKNIFELENQKLSKIKQMKKLGAYETAFATLNGCNKEISAKNAEDLCCDLITDVSVMSKVLIEAEAKMVSEVSVVKTLKNESMAISFQISRYLNSLGYYGQTELLRWLKTDKQINEIFDSLAFIKTKLEPGFVSLIKNSDYPDYTNLVIAEKAFKTGRYEVALELFENYIKSGLLATKILERIGQVLFELKRFHEASNYFYLAASFPNAPIVLEDGFSQHLPHVFASRDGRVIIYHRNRYYVLSDLSDDRVVSSVFGNLFIFSKKTRLGRMFRLLQWMKGKLGRNMAGTTRVTTKLKTDNLVLSWFKFCFVMFFSSLANLFVTFFMRGEKVSYFVDINELIEQQKEE